MLSKTGRFYWTGEAGAKARAALDHGVKLFVNERGRVDWKMVAVFVGSQVDVALTPRACREKHQSIVERHDNTRATRAEREHVLALVHLFGGSNFAAVRAVYNAETSQRRSTDWIRNVHSAQAGKFKRWLASKDRPTPLVTGKKARMPQCGHLWKRHGPELGFGCCRRVYSPPPLPRVAVAKNARVRADTSDRLPGGAANRGAGREPAQGRRARRTARVAGPRVCSMKPYFTKGVRAHQTPFSPLLL